MLVLTVRTDKPEAEIGLYQDDKQLAYETWTADRQLAETIHAKTEELLKNQNKTWNDLEGVVCFKGPGSFTGLRIGMSVVNALSWSLAIPVTAAAGDNWIALGMKKLGQGKNEKNIVPEYGGTVYTTTPKK